MITGLVTASSDIAFRTHAPLMQQLRTKLYGLRLAAPPASSGAGNHSEHATFTKVFTALLTALVPQFERLGPTMSPTAASGIESTEEEIFWELWMCLVEGCHAFKAVSAVCPELLPQNKLRLYALFYTAAHALLTWLLPMTRRPAWRSAAQHRCLRCRDTQLLVVLTHSACCLMNLTRTSRDTMFVHLRLLPPSFLPLLCCITSEQFGPPDLVFLQPTSAAAAPAAQNPTHTLTSSACSAPVHPHLLHTMVAHAINNMAANVESDEDLIIMPFLIHPSVFQLLKVMILMPAGPQLPYHSQLASHSMSCLVDLLNISLMDQENHDDSLMCTQSAETERDPLGLPLRLNPSVSGPALETDSRLLHVLGTRRQSNLSGGLEVMKICITIQRRILKSWLNACYYNPPREPALSVLAGSVIGLAQQCTAYGLLFMNATKQKLRGFNKQAGEHARVQQAQGVELTTSDPDCMCQRRLMMIHIMDFMRSEYSLSAAGER